MANSRKIYAYGAGTLQITSSVNGLECQQELEDAYYAPGVHVWLVSLGKLKGQGWGVSLHEGRMELQGQEVSCSYAKGAHRLIPAILDSPWTVPSLRTCLHRACQPWASLYLINYDISLNYICYYLYICLYNVPTLPSLYIDLAPLPHSLSFNIISYSSSSGVTLSLSVDTTPTRSISSVQPMALCHWLPPLGLRMMLNRKETCLPALRR